MITYGFYIPLIDLLCLYGRIANYVTILTRTGSARELSMSMINGDFISLENLRLCKNVKCNFLEYGTMKQEIQSIHTNHLKERTVGLILPIMLDKINLSGKAHN